MYQLGQDEPRTYQTGYDNSIPKDGMELRRRKQKSEDSSVCEDIYTSSVIFRPGQDELMRASRRVS